MGSRSNLSEKLWQAIDTLATGDGELQERLVSASLSLTGVYLPPESDLPKKIQDEFDSIKQDLTRETAKGNEGKIQATTRIMSDQEAEGVAKRILSLFIQLKGGI